MVSEGTETDLGDTVSITWPICPVQYQNYVDQSNNWTAIIGARA